mmetsp:Transcript_86954/g.241139  ORF Transcript_86954/g.241139 Transcript_86954/m.241139 type:complete len:115 (+) Transcript_86954:286-630(+)
MYEEFAVLAEMDGVELLLFPCGQFGGQELGTDEEIKDFIGRQGLIGKPNVHVMTKSDVTGGNMHPAWKVMKELTGAPDPGWNFDGKFVIGKTGDIKTVPRGTKVTDLINEALAE